MKRTALLVPMLVLVAACASVPRAKPVDDVKDLAGNWEAWLPVPWEGAPSSAVKVQLTVKDDGSYTAATQFLGSLLGEQRTLAPSFRTLHGVIRVSGGQAVYQPDGGRAGGTVTLFEGDGRRMLRFSSASATGPVDFTPSK